jgi:PRC-barrel domain
MVKRFVGASLALVCMTAVGLAQTPRQERRDERRDDRQPVPVQPVPNQQVPVQQQPAPGEVRGQGQVQYDSRQPQTHKVKSVIGTKVSIQGGLAIGTVDDIIFDDDGYIDYLVVLNEGKYVLVPWQAAKFNFEQRAATVNITQQQFQQVPTFTVQSWPTFDANYNARIYGYYGLTPHDRRVERRTERRNP